ncbi:hypothetical protein EVAR_51083_1 [Eumeta japonica]|uniref:Uncharacterized protein n=1 Tax=Eumeta variegata TaxID=151549 RepID=A0A4C1XLS3_EUMVA|nr:hypothetical protein EVAR_51083_1 [Eumeta japonica]
MRLFKSSRIPFHTWRSRVPHPHVGRTYSTKAIQITTKSQTKALAAINTCYLLLSGRRPEAGGRRRDGSARPLGYSQLFALIVLTSLIRERRIGFEIMPARALATSSVQYSHARGREKERYTKVESRREKEMFTMLFTPLPGDRLRYEVRSNSYAAGESARTPPHHLAADPCVYTSEQSHAVVSLVGAGKWVGSNDKTPHFHRIQETTFFITTLFVPDRKSNNLFLFSYIGISNALVTYDCEYPWAAVTTAVL